ncbi:unnamed protein product [Fusarium graminearum]|nr:unnamed protein product [Fusarium graminearum]
MATVTVQGPFFKDLPTLSAKVNSLLAEDVTTLAAAIDSALKSGGLDSVSTRRLLFFQGLTADNQLLLYLTTNYGNVEPSLARIGLENYFNSFDGFNKDVVKDFRSHLWEKEPLAVLLASLRQTKLLTTVWIELKPQIDTVLQLCVDKELSLSSPEIHTRVKELDVTRPKTEVKKDVKGKSVVVPGLRDAILAIQRLHCLVIDPMHLEVLLREGWHSAHDIAILPRGVFLSVIEQAAKNQDPIFNIDEESASRIHDHAITIDCRNQETWVKILDGLKRDFTIVVPQSRPEDEAEKKRKQEEIEKQARKDGANKDAPRVDVLAHKNYNMSTIFDLQTSSCEECCSVTGPAAYFVDLLNFLKASPCTGAGSKFSTLFQALMHRRPDLQDLELSCANSKNMVPYISIVNETLESFIASLSEHDDDDKYVATVLAVNEQEAPGSYSGSTQDTRLTAAKSLDGVMSPLNVFPHNQGLQSIKTYLHSFGITGIEVLKTFRSEARLLEAVIGALPSDKGTRATLLSEAGVILDRATVAASLNLLPLDLAAIVGEKIYTPHAMRSMMGMRQKRGKSLLSELEVPETCRNWGYSSTSDMIDMDERAKTGLCFIRSQFMPRSGLSFEEILQLLKSLYFGGRLVITNADKTKAFTGQISEMRLQALNTAATAPKETAVGPLTDQLCHEIQAFIRLKNRLGWSIKELDGALSAIFQSQVASGVMRTPDGTRGISFGVLQDLSMAKSLAESVNMPIDAILILWAPLNTESPLFSRVFGGPRNMSSDNIFTTLSNRVSLIKNHLPAVMTALGHSQDQLNCLMRAANIDSAKDKLTMDVLTKLYRHSTMSRILKATPMEYLELLSLLPAGLDILQDPITTLSFVTKWRQLVDSRWSPQEIIMAIRPTPVTSISDNYTNVTDALFLSSSIIEEMEVMRLLWQDPVRDMVVRHEDIVQICGELYDATAAASIVEFIEGTQSTEARIPLSKPLGNALMTIKVLPSNMTLTAELGSKTKPGVLVLSLQGVLSSENRLMIETLIKNKDAGLKASTSTLGTELRKDLDELFDDLEVRSSGARKTLEDRLLITLPADQREELGLMFQNDIRDGTSTMTLDEALIQAEMAVKKRRSAFILAALPVLRAQLVERSLIGAIGKAVAGLDPSVLAMLGTQVFKQHDKSATKVIEDICSDYVSNKGASEVSTAFFCPAASDTYQFHFTPLQNAEQNGEDSSFVPLFSVNGVDIPVLKASDGNGWQSVPTLLATGKPYLLSSSTNLGHAQWTTKQSTQPQKFMKSTLIPADIVTSVYNELLTVVHFAQLMNKLNLGLEEFKYLSSDSTSPMQVDLNRLTIDGLCQLETYCTLRDSVSSGPDALIGYFAWLGSGQDDRKTSLATRLAAATRWDKLQLNTALELKYPGLTEKDIIGRFASSLDELCSLRDVIMLSGHLGAASGRRTAQPLLVLFKVAVPAPPTETDWDMETASALELCLGPGQATQCRSELRETQRTAYVQFLLQRKYIQRLGVTDADGLFAHFMLDVQMGAQLEITRIKAAISTVQLFVQRVLLGLEAPSGVLDARIDKDKWAWMQRHNIWQATRKAFLYPENWIDPSLRDDKTPLFEAYESAIMSKDLSWDSFSQSMKDYVQSLLGIADLSIEAYLRELRPDEVEIYHFFGRTRSAPFEFYYRAMQIVKSGSGEGLVFWSPWTKVGVEAPTYDTDWNGKTLDKGGCYLVPVVRNKRLFLYLPQLMAKPVAPTPNMTMEDMAKKVPVTTGVYTWEVRMGWTEFVDGQWTPKRVLQTPLVVNWIPPTTEKPTDIEGLPSVDKFVFSAETTGPDVKIQVGYRGTIDGMLHYIGRFDVIDERIETIKVTSQTDKLGKALDTSFHKLTWEAEPNIKETMGQAGELKEPDSSLYSMLTKAEETPLLAIGKRDYKRNLTWTLSYADKTNNTNKTAGLVVDERRGGADGTTFFMYPYQTPEDKKKKTVPLATNLMYDQSREEIVEHSAAREMMEAVCQTDGLNMLFDTMDTNLTKNHDYGKAVVRSDMSNYHELTTPYAIYNWELGLHAVLLAIDRFYATQQFELALKAARLIFDPTTNPPTGCSADEAAAACWRFRPFRDLAEHKIGMVDVFKGWPSDGNLEIAVSERRSNPSTVHSTARGRPQAYMKWVIMKYIEILISAGDEYFRQGSMETLPLAIHHYVEAAHVLGPDPPRVPQLAKSVVKTFREIGSPEHKVDLELAFPFLCEIERRGSKRSDGDSRRRSPLLCILTTTYFSLPPNPKYASLRVLVQDRLYKARNNLDINGRPIVYSMSEPFIDPGDAMRALAQGGAGAVGSLMNDSDSPMPYQRFSFLISKALELCNELRSMGEQFLSVRERHDAESLAQLKNRQDSMRQKMILDVRLSQTEEILKTIESLQQSRASTVSQLEYYLRLTGDSLDLIPGDEKDEWQDIRQDIATPISDDLRMSPFETMELASAAVASTLNVAAAGMDTLAGFLKAFPNVTTNAQPMGCGVTVKADASNAAQLTLGLASATKTYALIASEAGSMSARIGGLTKQLQERRMQANIRGREIKNLDKQIEIQRKRLDINAKEILAQRSEVEYANETEVWYRSKYTNANLYSWLEGSVRSIHYDLYGLASDMCRRAERAFRFERGHQASAAFLRSGGYWDNSRDGLLAAQQLALDLRRMEAAYLHKPGHDWELSKNISLRKTNPHALLTLREKGTTTFSIPELLFDLDFPGHYMRRLKSVAVTIPCVIGPYTTLAATLSLTQHTYRVSAAAQSGDDYLLANSSDGSFRTDPIPISAVATSHAVQDTGSFDFGFNQSNIANTDYGPFEGAGAISNWKLELPPKTTQPFDYSTISDVVLHIKYTSIDGGPILKRSASDAVKKQCARTDSLGVHDGLWGFVEVRNEATNQWFKFSSTLSQTALARTATLDLGPAITSRLPFWIKNRDVKIETLTLAITGADAGLAKDLSIPALGSSDWDCTTLGDIALLSIAGLGDTVSLKQEEGQWQLKLVRDKGVACDIKDIVMYFRYVVL